MSTAMIGLIWRKYFSHTRKISWCNYSLAIHATKNIIVLNLWSEPILCVLFIFDWFEVPRYRGGTPSPHWPMTNCIFFFFLFFSPANLWCSQNFVWKSQFDKFWLEFDRTIWRTKEFYRYNTPEEFFDGRWINRVNLNFLYLPNLLFETVLSKKFRAFSIFCSHISIICSHWTIYSNESLTNRSSVNDEKK